jgi:hypothetical protein
MPACPPETAMAAAATKDTAAKKAAAEPGTAEEAAAAKAQAPVNEEGCGHIPHPSAPNNNMKPS